MAKPKVDVRRWPDGRAAVVVVERKVKRGVWRRTRFAVTEDRSER